MPANILEGGGEGVGHSFYRGVVSSKICLPFKGAQHTVLLRLLARHFSIFSMFQKP